MIEKAITDGKPYDLIVADMHFSIYGCDNLQAGTNVIMELRGKGIDTPVVVCSSHPYKETLAIDNIFYNHPRLLQLC